MIPCIVYGVKSSPDEKDAVATQVAECLKCIEAEGDREVVGQPFTEERASGYLRERGPRLELALSAAKRAAETHDVVELWVWHTSRLARGRGTKGDPRALGALLYDLRAAGVSVRSTTDDEFARNEMLWGVASQMASKYSADVSAFVRAGKQRQRDAGKFLGGPPNDGYKQQRRADGTMEPRTLDDERVPTVRRLLALVKTMGDNSVARRLNAEGFRRRSGKLWDRRSVQAIATNPIYSGRFKNRDGSDIPGIVTPAEYVEIQTIRAGRDRSAAGRKRAQDGMPRGGRPTTRYVMAKLGTCARCGGPMYAKTSTYARKKDGVRARSYMCANSPTHNKTTATCDAPKIDAETADAAILPHLRGFFVDFEGWLSRVTSAEADEREGIRRTIAATARRLEALTAAQTKAHDRYVAALADDASASRIDALETALERITAEAAQYTASISELEDSLAGMEDNAAPVDAMLDWWNTLSGGIREALDAADTVDEINGRLRETLSEIQMDTLPDGRIKLVAVFADRGEWVPLVDENDEPMWDEAPDFFPDQVDIFARPGLATALPAYSSKRAGTPNPCV
jgi:DNA invertase Pin-like site-specific DNA recombinase